jgi:hypothetical protein
MVSALLRAAIPGRQAHKREGKVQVRRTDSSSRGSLCRTKDGSEKSHSSGYIDPSEVAGSEENNFSRNPLKSSSMDGELWHRHDRSDLTSTEVADRESEVKDGRERARGVDSWKICFS